MTYNIHPLLVHFPIALLFLYSILKIIPLSKWFPNISWRQIERTLLFFGVLGAFAALLTGNVAKHLIQPNRALVGAHSNFAYLATFIFCILLLGEIFSVIKSKENFLCYGLFSNLLAFLGLIAISVTGLLGGVMVYGLSADPFAKVVLKLLGISL